MKSVPLGVGAGPVVDDAGPDELDSLPGQLDGQVTSDHHGAGGGGQELDGERVILPSRHQADV